MNGIENGLVKFKFIKVEVQTLREPYSFGGYYKLFQIPNLDIAGKILSIIPIGATRKSANGYGAIIFPYNHNSSDAVLDWCIDAQHGDTYVVRFAILYV